MSDSQKSDNSVGENENTGSLRVGAQLRKARLDKSISLEQLAEDLKFQVEYLDAIEENRYDSLPAIPYVRAYIRTIAQYLELDTEFLLEQFSREVNMAFPDPERERHETISISIQREKQHSHWVPISVIALIATILTILIHFKNGSELTTDEVIADSLRIADSLAKVSTVVETLSVDTVPAPAFIPPVDTVASVETTDSTAHVDSQLSLVLAITGDSSWIAIQGDGVPLREGMHYKGDTIEHQVNDVFYVRVGLNSAVSYHRNGEPLLIDGNSLRITKITDSTVDVISTKAWNKVAR